MSTNYKDLAALGVLLNLRRGVSYEEFATQMSRHGVVSRMSAYQLLEKLQAGGMLTQKRVPIPRGRPKNLYRVTEKGRRFGKVYRARLIGRNPALVAFGQFV